jgi:hypothetical protein
MTLCDHDDGFGNPQYEYSIATDVAGIVFNSGAGVSDGGHQTVDITYDNDTSGWYPTGETDDEGKDLVDSWIFEDPDPIPDPTTAPDPSDTKRIEFTDNKGWGSVNIYIYGPDGELSAWPGFGMNQKGDNGYGGINYYYDVPTNAEFVIFSNGDGTEQTVVFGRGAVRISSRELIYEMRQARQSGEQYAHPAGRASGRTTIMEHMPEDVRARLEKLRRGEQ